MDVHDYVVISLLVPM